MSTTTKSPQVARISTRFLVISDTHSATPEEKPLGSQNVSPLPMPKADVLLHCGDLTMIGKLHEYEKTMDLLESIDADLKLVIAGNHDISLDEIYYRRKGQFMHSQTGGYSEDLPAKAKVLWLGERAKSAGVTYLDEGTHSFTLKNGARLRVYASPYQPEFCDWAFPYFRNEDRYNPSHQCTPNAVPIAENPIPDYPAIDVMMTHGPPMGVLDTTYKGESVGCQHLLRAARRCKPRLHCFGHIHEAWGAQKVTWTAGDQLDMPTEEHIEESEEIQVDEEILIDKDDHSEIEVAKVDFSKAGGKELRYGLETLMVNASIMTLRYKPWNRPWLIDMDLEKAD